MRTSKCFRDEAITMPRQANPIAAVFSVIREAYEGFYERVIETGRVTAPQLDMLIEIPGLPASAEIITALSSVFSRQWIIAYSRLNCYRDIPIKGDLSIYKSNRPGTPVNIAAGAYYGMLAFLNEFIKDLEAGTDLSKEQILHYASFGDARLPYEYDNQVLEVFAQNWRITAALILNNAGLLVVCSLQNEISQGRSLLYG